jgi:hypothetical protein
VPEAEVLEEVTVDELWAEVVAVLEVEVGLYEVEELLELVM